MASPLVQVPEAFRSLYTEEARYRAFYGGRGGGKSWQLARAALIKGAQQPLRVLCCREIQNSIKDSVKRLLDDNIASYPALKGFYTSTDTEVRGRNGTLFAFSGLRNNPESVKSKEGFDVAWVEEAATVSRRSLELLVPTIRKAGSEIWFSWNPRYNTDPVDEMFRGEKGAPPRSIVREIQWYDNPWFPKELREEMEWDRARDPDKYAHVWMGGYLTNSESRIFRNWSVEPFETPKSARLYFGADWGFANDPTVLVRCWAKDRTLYVDYETRAVGCEIEDTPELFDNIPESRMWPIRADNARPETISHMQRHGFPRMTASNKGAGSIEDGIAFLKSYDIKIHPRCRHLADEFALYSYKTDRLTGDVLPIIVDKHSDGPDALRYAIEPLRQKRATATVEHLYL